MSTHAGSLLLCCLHFSDKKSEQAKDMHLMKRLTSALKTRDMDPGKDLENLLRLFLNDNSCFLLFT